MPSSEKKPPENLVEKVFIWIKSKPIFSIPIIIGIVIISLANFTNAITDIKTFFSPMIDSTSENSVPTVNEDAPRVRADKNLFNVSLALDFDSVDDLDYFDILSEDENTPKIKIDQGNLYLGPESANALNLRPILTYETAIHVRWEINDEQACYAFPFAVKEEYTEETHLHRAGLSSCTNGALQSFFPDSDGVNAVEGESSSLLITKNNEWIEAVFWIEEASPAQFRGIGWKSEKPSEYAVFKGELLDWGEENAFLLSMESYEGEILIDSLYTINGNIESYLWFHSPPFTAQSDAVLDFFEGK